MTFNDEYEDDDPVRADVTSNLAGHNQRYRRYIQRLKQGQSSGISFQFGKAADLLPGHASTGIGINVSETSGNPPTVLVPAAADHSSRLVVTANDGSHLWTIFFKDSEVARVEMSDGSFIALAEDGVHYVLVQKQTTAPQRIVVAEGVLINPRSGNVYWQGLGAKVSGAFLNNGWQIDQFNDDDLRPRSFIVSEPAITSDIARVQHVVSKLAIDLDNDDVTFEMSGGGPLVTLHSRKI